MRRDARLSRKAILYTTHKTRTISSAASRKYHCIIVFHPGCFNLHLRRLVKYLYYLVSEAYVASYYEYDDDEDVVGEKKNILNVFSFRVASSSFDFVLIVGFMCTFTCPTGRNEEKKLLNAFSGFLFRALL